MATTNIREVYETEFKPAYEKRDRLEMGRLVVKNRGLLDCLEHQELLIAQGAIEVYTAQRASEIEDNIIKLLMEGEHKMTEYKLKLTIYGVEKPEKEGGNWTSRDYSESEGGTPLISKELLGKLEQEMIDNFSNCAVAPIELNLTIRQNNPLDRLSLVDKIKNLVKRR